MCNKKVKSSKAGWLYLIWMSSAHCDERLFQGTAVARIEGPQYLGLCVNLPPSCSSPLYNRTWLPLIRPSYQLGPWNKATRKWLWESKTYHCRHHEKKLQFLQLLKAEDHINQAHTKLFLAGYRCKCYKNANFHTVPSLTDVWLLFRTKSSASF